MRVFPLLSSAIVMLALSPAAFAQTIYPLNRAEILSGAKFDFKVEFPGSPARDAVSVTINGEDAVKLLGGKLDYLDK